MTEVNRVLFSINHPAQVHLFKHAIEDLEERGCEVLVASREKEMTTDLLDAYDIDHECLTVEGDSILGVIGEFSRREIHLYRLARRFDPDVIVSRLAPPAVHVSRLLGCRSLVYQDTVYHSRLLETVYHGVTLPCIDDICTPPGFDMRVPFGEQHTVDFQELTYLHPDRFDPNPRYLREHGIDPESPYFVLRLAGWDAYHDIGEGGMSPELRDDLLDTLTDHGDVYITSETPLPSEYEQYRLPVPAHHVHDLLYYADLYLGDSRTMPTEAALLGTPAIMVNSLVGEYEMHNFVELEEKYGLLFSYADARPALTRAEQIARGDVDGEWERQRNALVADKGDVTAHMVGLILDREVTAPSEESEPRQKVRA